MDDLTQKVISIFSGSIGMPVDLLMIYLAGWVLLTKRRELTKASFAIAFALLSMGLGGLFRVDYWAFALFLAPPGQAYHGMFIAERWRSYVFGMPGLFFGMVVFLLVFFREKRRLIYGVLAFSVLYASTIAGLFYASEVGHWDRGQLVEWFDRQFPHDTYFDRVIIRGDD